MKLVGLVPLRAGSKSIPQKNIKVIAGKPLFYWSLKAAVDSGIFSEIYVSSDSQTILDSVTKYFPKVKPVLRSADLAQDTTSSEAVLLDFAKDHGFDCISLIQATSPLTTADDFRAAWAAFQKSGADSLLTGCRSKRFFWKDSGEAINYDFTKRPRRQDFQGTLVENGAFYFTKRQILESKKNRLGGRIQVYEMSEENLAELDEPSDWLTIEKLLLKRTQPRLQDFKAMVLDVDGTLTDGRMFYSAEGEFLKAFYTQDAHGLGLLRQKGFSICVITAEDSPSVHSRMKKLGVEHYHCGVKNKLEILQQWIAKQGYDMSEVIYGGDDLGDLECMQIVGYSFCPADAAPKIKSIAHYVCQKNGGAGAVREFVDLLLETNS